MINYIDINNKHIKYATIGKGKKTFIMLPGVFLTSVIDSIDAIKQAYNQFLDDYTIYLFDYKFVEKGFTLDDFADYFIEIFERLELSDLYFFGVSMGGMIAQIIAYKKPELIHSLFLASTLCKATDTFKNKVNLWLDYARKRNIKELNYDFYHSCFTLEYLDKYKDVLEGLYEVGSNSDCDDFIYALESMYDFDIEDKVNNIKCKTLVVGAYEDKVLGKDASVHLSEVINCDIYMYDKYSHAVYDEAPDYKDHIEEFFKD